jgi:hypothetical protein
MSRLRLPASPDRALGHDTFAAQNLLTLSLWLYGDISGTQQTGEDFTAAVKSDEKI